MVATWEDRKFEAGEAIAPKLLLLGLLRPEGWGLRGEKKVAQTETVAMVIRGGYTCDAILAVQSVVCEDIILKLLQNFDATVTHDL